MTTGMVTDFSSVGVLMKTRSGRCSRLLARQFVLPKE